MSHAMADDTSMFYAYMFLNKGIIEESNSSKLSVSCLYMHVLCVCVCVCVCVLLVCFRLILVPGLIWQIRLQKVFTYEEEKKVWKCAFA